MCYNRIAGKGIHTQTVGAVQSTIIIIIIYTRRTMDAKTHTYTYDGARPIVIFTIII